MNRIFSKNKKSYLDLTTKAEKAEKESKQPATAQDAGNDMEEVVISVC